MSFSLISAKTSNLWIGKFSIFPDEYFVHGISTRHGGVSRGEFDSLNLGLHVNDDKSAVQKNRDIFLAGLGLTTGSGVTCQQIHGSSIYKVTGNDKGLGMYDYDKSIPGVDGLVTDVPDIPLMLFFADCTPILLADPIKKVIAVVHGGWKGTVESISEKAVNTMVKDYGCEAKNILAGIGPAIGACCYEVGDDVADKFKQAFPRYYKKILFRENDKYHLDLAETNKLQLINAGIFAENIDAADVCTSCNNRQFFSYRADRGKTGRIAAVLSIK